MNLDLGSEEREILLVVRRMADRLGTGSAPADWWRVLGESGFLALDVTDGESALQAACAAEALGEGIAPIRFAGYLTCRAVLAEAAGDVPAAALADWDAGRLEVFGIGHRSGPGQAVLEPFGEDTAHALVWDGDGWLLLAAADFAVRDRSVWDERTALAVIEWAEGAGHRLAPGGRDWNQLNIALHTAELVGVVRRTVERTIEYLRQREQFGRPIGSFQALQHRTADIVADLRACEATVEYATWFWGGTADEATRTAWVRAAAALVGEAATRAMRECLQFHGGIAMTEEFWFHHWMRRATHLITYQGGPAAHLAAVGAAVRAGVSLEVPLARS
jgi:hypothetical protein